MSNYIVRHGYEIFIWIISPYLHNNPMKAIDYYLNFHPDEETKAENY